MTVLAVRQEVRERVRERLLPVLFPRLVNVHCKREWRDCECSYCQKKRKNHESLQFTPLFTSHEAREDWRFTGIKRARKALLQEKQKILSGD